jgi:hypothetical protein
MDDRYSRYGQRDTFDRSAPQDYGRDYGSGRDYGYSSARDYAATGEYGQRRERSDYGAGSSRDWGQGGSRGGFAGGARDWGRERSDHRGRDWGERDYGNARGDVGRGRDLRGESDRGFFERAGDEVRSWFGDEEAERRREQDQRLDERQGRGERARHPHDDHYHSWRRERIAELDRDYDEYRRENAQRFHNEFSSWRTERQGQRDSLSLVSEHMEVVGSDGSHVGTVDKVRGDRIILTKNDAEAGGHHHSIPSRWIQNVSDKVTLRKTADEAKAHWRDEERSGALFGKDENARDDQNWSGERNLNRSFSGTY